MPKDILYDAFSHSCWILLRVTGSWGVTKHSPILFGRLFLPELENYRHHSVQGRQWHVRNQQQIPVQNGDDNRLKQRTKRWHVWEGKQAKVIFVFSVNFDGGVFLSIIKSDRWACGDGPCHEAMQEIFIEDLWPLDCSPKLLGFVPFVQRKYNVPLAHKIAAILKRSLWRSKISLFVGYTR